MRRTKHTTIHDLVAEARSRIREITAADLVELQRAGSPVVDIRSALAAEALKRLGFASPVSLAGGILHWADAGHAVVTPSPLESAAAPPGSPVAGVSGSLATCC